MNLLDLTYVIRLVRTFTTFVTLWEDNNPFKNLFALYIKHIKTYYHLCKEIRDNLGFWIPAFSWNLDSGLLGLYSGFQSPGFQIPQGKFSRIPEFPDSLPAATIQFDLQRRRYYAAFYLKSNRKGVQDIAWSPSDLYKPISWAVKVTMPRKHEVLFSLWRPQTTTNWGFKAWDQGPVSRKSRWLTDPVSCLWLH